MLAQFLNKILNLKNNLWLIPHKRRSRKIIFAYFKECKDCIKINIGSGANLLAGWLNTDIWPFKGTVYCDVAKRLPFPDSSVHLINSENLLEHLNYEAARLFLKECYRVLRPKGILRVSTPDLGRLIQIYSGSEVFNQEEILGHHRRYHNLGGENICAWFNDHMRHWGHQFIFDMPTLVNLLKEAGFSQIKPCRFGESECPQLGNIDRHDEGSDCGELAYVMIFQAYK